MPTCAHGYEGDAVRSDCPRCADRPHAVQVQGAPSCPQTRWRRTGTTLGPAAKVMITLVLVVPAVLMVNMVRLANTHLEYVFVIVPLTGLIILHVRFLPELWEPGRAPQPTSTTSAPGRQSGRRSTISPTGERSAATPGKSSSKVTPAWVDSATHTPKRRA